mgnify:CR=1 FL=1
MFIRSNVGKENPVLGAKSKKGQGVAIVKPLATFSFLGGL